MLFWALFTKLDPMTDDTITATRVCSVATAAEILGVGHTTALRWIHEGKLPVLGRFDAPRGTFVLDQSAIEEFTK